MERRTGHHAEETTLLYSSMNRGRAPQKRQHSYIDQCTEVEPLRGDNTNILVNVQRYSSAEETTLLY